jgi:hypothetical protein
MERYRLTVPRRGAAAPGRAARHRIPSADPIKAPERLTRHATICRARPEVVDLVPTRSWATRRSQTDRDDTRSSAERGSRTTRKILAVHAEHVQRAEAGAARPNSSFFKSVRMSRLRHQSSIETARSAFLACAPSLANCGPSYGHRRTRARLRGREQDHIAVDAHAT